MLAHHRSIPLTRPVTVGFFQMNLADSAVFAEDDDEPEKNPNSLKPMLPAGTSIDEVEKRFVYKLRKSLFNVESAIQDVTDLHTPWKPTVCITAASQGLGKPNSKAKYLRRDDLVVIFGLQWIDYELCSGICYSGIR